MLVLLFIMGLLLIAFYVYLLSSKRHDYWNKRNVPFPEPTIVFGNFKEYVLLKKSAAMITTEICEKFSGTPYIGLFYGTDPLLIVKEPSLIKLILSKDFYYFNGRELSDHSHKETATNNIFFNNGDRWKVLRQNLTPLFSSAKMKNMFYMIKQCCTELEGYLDRESCKSQVIEVKALMARYTVDAISLCAFGFNANTMGAQKDNPFQVISTKIIEASTYNGIKNVLRTLWPGIFYTLGLTLFNTDLVKFFRKLLIKAFKERNYESSNRNDFIDLILTFHKKKIVTGDSISNLKNGDTTKVSFKTDDTLLVSQCILFFAGGFETSSSTLSFVLFELAKHEEAQKRAIAEVDGYFLRHKDGVEYDISEEVPYLSACFDEALRLYPLFGVMTREATEDYTFPTGMHIEKGVRVHIPVYYLHHNPEYFPNPEEFIPERFLGENAKNIKPYTYFPFGEGPRICMGMRFAKMQVFAGLATILKNYTVKLADGTPRNFAFEPKVIVSQPAEPIWLKFIPRN